MSNSSPRLRRQLILSTALAAIGLGLPALAVAAETAPASTAAATPAVGAAVSEVIVTAERRATNLQKSPLAITAVPAQRLDKSFVNTAAGLNGIVPSLQITKASGFENLVTIRGVGSETPENSLTTTPGVSLFIDGVYIANTISLDQTLFDLDRIEVLRGPQGALYGESSIGGAIILNTKQPQLKEFSGSGDFSAGDYNLFRERAEVNVPLGDDFAARLSVQKYDHDGFTRDAAIPGFRLDAAHDVSGKVALLWRPTDNFQATLTGMWYHSSQAGDAQKNINDPSPDPRVVNQDYDGHFSLNTQLYHLNTTWDLPWFTIKTVTAYQVLDHVQREDGDRSTFAQLGFYDTIAAWNTTVHNFTEEFDILSRPGGPVDWIVGAFYLNQTSHQFVAEFGGSTSPAPGAFDIPGNIETAPPAGLNYGNDSHAVHQSYALFGQATWHVTDDFRLTAGGRMNLDNTEDPSLNFSHVFFQQVNISKSDNKRWDNVPTWRAEADYDLTHDNMLYASIAHGYKPGGANGSNGQVVIQPVFEPETNTAFEIGSKNSFFDRSLRVNISAFYSVHKNFQYIEVDPIPFDSGIANIPSIHDYGVELEANYVALDGRLRIDGNITYERGQVQGHYRTIDSTVAMALEGGPPSYGGIFGTNCQFFAAYGFSPTSTACWADVIASAKDIGGKTPPAMPAVSGSIAASYRFDVPMGSLTPRVEVVYRGAEWARIFNDPTLDRVPDYTVVNFNVEYALRSTPLRLSLTVTNAFDTVGVNSRYTDPFGTGQTSDQYIPPRQIIGTIAYSF
jgi:iron complex outermembrane receptor protein